MVDNELQVSVYMKDDYREPKSYMVYINGGGVFLFSKDACKMVQEKRNEVIEENINDFARANNYKHLLDAIYYNYEFHVVKLKPFIMSTLKEYLNEGLDKITKRSMNDNDPTVAALYCRIKLLIKALNKMEKISPIGR